MSVIAVNGQSVTLPVEVGKTWRGRKFEPNEVLVARPSRWGNPFVIGTDGTREEVCLKYYHYLKGQPDLLAELPTLRGKRLMCWCAPELCHGHIIGLVMMGY